MRRRVRLTATTIAMLTMIVTALGISAQPELDPAMTELWERSDLPVSDLTVSRSWLWGPQANHVLYEPYDRSSLPDGQRLVAYFDKSRMEINDPGGDPNSIWYVTNGLLVVELITGRIQLSDSEYEPAIPSKHNVTGDQGVRSPTYWDIEANLDQAPHAEDELIDSHYTWVAAGPGFTGKILWGVVDGSTAEAIVAQDIRAAHYVPETNHTIAAPFWEFMNSTGTVYENGQYVEGPIFRNPFLATGLPITEANWIDADASILFQCFERRCLTYTPGNAEGWQVEAGNVGQHYYEWRHIDGGHPCTSLPEEGIGKLWSNNAGLRAALRCPDFLPTDGRNFADREIATSYQRFEHGAMLWVDIFYGPGVYLNYQDIYVLYDDGSFEKFDDDWDNTQPIDDPSIVPPDGFYQPVAGFGKVWREQPGVRDRLGWAIAPESSSDGVIQPFQRGEMIWREAEDLIWVFYQDSWEVHEDTFDE